MASTLKTRQAQLKPRCPMCKFWNCVKVTSTSLNILHSSYSYHSNLCSCILSLSYRYALDNQFGIVVDNNYANSNAAAVTIEDVACKFNFQAGMVLSGPKIRVRDSSTSHNYGSGIYLGILGVRGPFYGDTSMIQFEGTVSSHHNVYFGIGIL